jgi:hypothetical protein
MVPEEFKIPLRNFEVSRRNRRPHASFFYSVPVSGTDMMAVLDPIAEGARAFLFCHLHKLYFSAFS